MTYLNFFISAYIFLSLYIGIYCTKYISSTKDFVLAGRNLPLVLCSSTMFSTWFGAETIVGAPAEFLEQGFLGVIEDPFGTSLCFLLIGVFFAKQIYKLNITTIVDLFRIKFGIIVEKISAVFMILSYIGWIAAQLLAMAIIIRIVFDLPILYGVTISSIIVCIYTISGGMWSISINDFIQTMVIIIGLVAICLYLYFTSFSYQKVINNTPENFFRLYPGEDFSAWIKYIVAWMTIGLGSIPQQDVFQRVMAAKSERVAVMSSYISGVLYLLIGLLPLFIALSFASIDDSLSHLSYDQVLLQAIMHNTNVVIKILFFGALLSAIMSSASGAILAPATILGENIIRPIKPEMSDKKLLFIMRISVLFIVVISSLYAIYTPNVYLLVAESSIVSLVSLFIPLVAAIYWVKANTAGALASIILGPAVWLFGVYYGLAELSVLLALLFSFLVTLICGYLPRKGMLGVSPR